MSERPSATSGRTFGERLATFPSTARERVSRDPRVQKLLYPLRNRRAFADLYQHDRMLGDDVRVDSYWQAIEKHIGPGDVVIDLGTGTGVLALFAALQGARVHAIEHGPIIEAAKAVARDNGIETIEFHRVNSRDFDLPDKVDAIVHEQIGEAAYDERLVENIGDLRDRLLKPGGKILPHQLDLYMEPVQLREDLRAPFAWQQKLHGIDFRAVEGFAQHTHRYLYRVANPFPFGHFLCEPEPVVEIDLLRATADDLPQTIAYERQVTQAGHFDGYCVYFDARFDDEVWFTSSPAAGGTSWGAPHMRTPTREVEPGDTIRLELTAGDLAAPATWDWGA